ncbi:MAG: hypothetical protein AB7O24_07800 [Kofleriaceae bacterium]
MIAEPVNDRKCLSQVTEVARELVRERDSRIEEIAARFSTTKELVAWIRSLPQRDDEGDPNDGPKVNACSPPQRLRIPAPDPNCFERSILLLSTAELIDPEPTRSLVTINTPDGRHTFPLENGEPVVLDPLHTRNGLAGALFALDRERAPVSSRDAVNWIATIAEDPADRSGARHRVRNARTAMRRVLAGKPISPRAVRDVAYTVAVADREARKFGARGRALHRRTAGTIASTLARRNAKLGSFNIKPDYALLTALARVGGRIGTQLGAAALQAQLGKLGLGPQVLGALERELNREGASLGLLAGPAPASGSLAARASDALIAGAFRNNERNASWISIKTPGVIWDEMMTTRNEMRALGADIHATFRKPWEDQLALAETRFEKERGRKPGVGRDSDPPRDYAQVYAWMTPVPTAADIEHKSYQGKFVYQWGEFEKEWDAFLATHDNWYERLWKGDYDKAIEFRERVVKWREQFQRLGGTPTTPAPTLPPDEGPIPWKTIITVAGIGAAALIVPEALRSLRSRSESTRTS